jgi:hypothetical protein
MCQDRTFQAELPARKFLQQDQQEAPSKQSGSIEQMHRRGQATAPLIDARVNNSRGEAMPRSQWRPRECTGTGLAAATASDMTSEQPSGPQRASMRLANLADDPLGNGEGVLPGGINMRGHGGFIVAPGSVRPDGQLWCEPDDGLRLASAFATGIIPRIPQWLVDMIRAPKASDPAPQDVPSIQWELSAVTERERIYAARALESECTRVSQALPGTCNETLNKAAFSLGTMAGAGWIEPDLVRSELIAAGQNCGLVRDDGAGAARNTIESGLKAGISEPRAPLPERGFGTIGTIGTQDESVWGEPDLSYLGSGRPDPVPFPIELLGPFWGRWCQAHATARCVPVDYVAAGLLASASALIGNARWTQAGPEWREPPVLWLAIIGSPSAGKSPALDPPLSIVRRIERRAIEAIRPEREAYQEAVELAQANPGRLAGQGQRSPQERENPTTPPYRCSRARAHSPAPHHSGRHHP